MRPLWSALPPAWKLFSLIKCNYHASRQVSVHTAASLAFPTSSDSLSLWINGIGIWSDSINFKKGWTVSSSWSEWAKFIIQKFVHYFRKQGSIHKLILQSMSQFTLLTIFLAVCIGFQSIFLKFLVTIAFEYRWTVLQLIIFSQCIFLSAMSMRHRSKIAEILEAHRIPYCPIFMIAFTEFMHAICCILSMAELSGTTGLIVPQLLLPFNAIL